MGNKLIAIKIQSYTDLITNSSSELFQLKTDSTVEQVQNTLQNITTGYIRPVFFSAKEYHENKCKFREMLQDCAPLPEFSKETEKEWNEAFQAQWDYRDKLIEEHPEYYIYDVVSGWFFDKDDPKRVSEAYKNYLCCDKPHSWDSLPLNDLQEKFHKFVLEDEYEEGDRLDSYHVSDELVEEFLKDNPAPNIDDIWDWAGYDYGRVEDLDGCIIVLSEDDNSIPYETWDEINTLFNGTNYHLG